MLECIVDGREGGRREDREVKNYSFQSVGSAGHHQNRRKTPDYLLLKVVSEKCLMVARQAQ